VHVSAVLKDSATYEHTKPGQVGNRQRVLLSELSGRGNVLYKLKQHGLGQRLDDQARRELLDRIKQMEYEGYELEAAEGTCELAGAVGCDQAGADASDGAGRIDRKGRRRLLLGRVAGRATLVACTKRRR